MSCYVVGRVSERVAWHYVYVYFTYIDDARSNTKRFSVRNFTTWKKICVTSDFKKHFSVRKFYYLDFTCISRNFN
jgi:hypothetical protein